MEHGSNNYVKVNFTDQWSKDIYGSDMFPNEKFECHAYHPINEMVGELMSWAIVYTETNGVMTIYLVFRGTQSLQDGLIDVSYVPIPVENPNSKFSRPESAKAAATTSIVKGKLTGDLLLHSGIFAAVKMEYEAIIKSLESLMNGKGAGKSFRFYCTGHSLGGGYAQTFGVMLVNEKTLNGLPLVPSQSEDMPLLPKAGSCYFTVISMASPLLLWQRPANDTVRTLKDLNVIRKKENFVQTVTNAAMFLFRLAFYNSYLRASVRYFVTKKMLNTIVEPLYFITNIVNLKDVVPRAQIAIKNKWTIQNMVTTNIPNIGSFMNKTKNLTAWNASDLYQVIPDTVVGYRPLGRTFVITVDDKKLGIWRNAYKLKLVDCSERNDWFMLEYSKTFDKSYPVTLKFQDSIDDGWKVEDHNSVFYLRHLAACGSNFSDDIKNKVIDYVEGDFDIFYQK